MIAFPEPLQQAKRLITSMQLLHACLSCRAEAGLGLPSLGGLWNVAKAVQSAVQQTADEVVRSVQQTDWKSELAAFTHEVEAEAHKAVEVVQHLPAQLHTITAEVRNFLL
jgi:hypothetical protein